MTTKQQERDALAKIRKIVESLGEGSYIGTAFEGCFQDAEENIENDFGCSMKQRLESAEFAEQHLREKLADATKKQAEDAAEISRLKADLECARRSNLPHPLRAELLALMTEASDTARVSMASAAETMAEMADAPQDIAFKHAVEQYRKVRAQAERCERLLSDLDAIETT